MAELVLKTVDEWLQALKDGELDIPLRGFFGGDEQQCEINSTLLERCLRGHHYHYGENQKVAVFRCPGRVNLIGMHIDHQGGTVNPIGVKNMWVVASPREDNRIIVANGNPHYPLVSYLISDELPDAPVRDWENWTAENSARLETRGLGKDWGNYFRAASCYFANLKWCEEKIPPTSFKGMNAFLVSSMPTSVDLASSSSLIVCASSLLCNFNGLKLTDKEMIEHTSRAEWYCGTLSGSGDHAAIILSMQGHMTSIGLFPFDYEHIRFPDDYRIVLTNSVVSRITSRHKSNLYNIQVATYKLGTLLLKSRLVQKDIDQANRISMLCDIDPDKLGISDKLLLDLVLDLPKSVARHEVSKLVGEDEYKQMERLFLTHETPADGYPVRDVSLYGLAETIRSRLARQELERGNIEEFGRLMNLSHDGDRVSFTPTGSKTRQSWDNSLDQGWMGGFEDGQQILFSLPGAYRASNWEADQLVDTSLAVDGVLGARLTGSGFGGCVAVLVHRHAVGELIAKLEREYYSPQNCASRAEICQPIQGATFLEG